jgi:hypothetical protein
MIPLPHSRDFKGCPLPNIEKPLKNNANSIILGLSKERLDEL